MSKGPSVAGVSNPSYYKMNQEGHQSAKVSNQNGQHS